jgi:exodeoxyribonuclease-3
VATFNANSIRSRLPIVLDWLAAHRPDVLGLQETKVQDTLFPAAAFEAAGYRVVFRGQKAYNGVALVSREPARDVRFGLDDGGEPDEARLISATVGPLRVVNTYVPQGREIEHEMFAYKLRWFARLKDYFARHFTPRQRLVWVGDLNVAPAPMDVHNPREQTNHVCFHDAVRQAFADAVSWGFVDVFRKHHPEPGQYTFFDYRMPRSLDRGLGWRVDHVLATPPLAAASTDCFIDLAPRRAEKPSDHTFVAADFAV